MATVTPIHYRGTVWCVRVSTGAFVARRNGRVFITGNSGFPKATRIDTQIDKVAGAKREVVGRKYEGLGCRRNGGNDYGQYDAPQELEGLSVTAPATPLAAAWEGHRYGLQALKPAVEPIIVFQKPYEGKPVECIVETGAGALWIDGGRVGTSDNTGRPQGADIRGGNYVGSVKKSFLVTASHPSGRWPANLILQHDPECRRVGDEWECTDTCPVRRLGEGDEARFFHQSDWSLDVAEQIAAADPVRYQAKASRRERDAGLDEADVSYWSDGREKTADYPKQRAKTPRRNPHPTVKPIALIQYLATLLLPPAMYAPRRILVPFAGSGSEMIGAGLAGWEEIVGIEAEAEYCEIAEPRLRYWLMQPALI